MEEKRQEKRREEKPQEEGTLSLSRERFFLLCGTHGEAPVR
jgi:hypothetical protein